MCSDPRLEGFVPPVSYLKEGGVEISAQNDVVVWLEFEDDLRQLGESIMVLRLLVVASRGGVGVYDDCRRIGSADSGAENTGVAIW